MCGRSRVVLRGGVLQKSCGAGSDSAGARSKTEAESEKEIRNFGKWKRWEEASAERPGPRASLSQVRAMVMKYRDRLMCECHLDSR